MLVKGKNSIEEKVRHEAEGRRLIRKQLDQLSGLSRSTGPQRGDFKTCRDADKVLKEYREHKDPRDREKIRREYEQVQKEGRRL